MRAKTFLLSPQRCGRKSFPLSATVIGVAVSSSDAKVRTGRRCTMRGGGVCRRVNTGFATVPDGTAGVSAAVPLRTTSGM